ncbi:Membrane-anchored ribosome-binding protein, inhibits growth in stationary phase, ElaB/YqjD/DUF883 family [Cupriavidus sp. YR651]|uniref:DUF883 family protein n=1 Tax=Cupriavidus sp. YR651 TaxID=1855315 RepID=UPI00088E1411|nr:DUF883 family protein [Cupriavidus sp. YR651]SDD82024.1 Membrane-anchored ribosome-binding protein, inhibits growth in stationary phase, ElaB/YqjD/DUF883 family [Cupriavidus sp. YR651]
MNDIRADLLIHKDVLIRDANTLLADVQALLRDVADEASLETAQARAQIGSRLQALQDRLNTQRQAAQMRVSQWADTTDRYVHSHPWESMGSVAAVAAVAGALVALAVTRR